MLSVRPLRRVRVRHGGRPLPEPLPLTGDAQWPGRGYLSLMSSQRGEAQSLCVGRPTDGVLAGALVGTAVWGQCGLEGSFTNHWSAETSQLETTSPLGSMQSSAVVLVHVPASVRRPTLNQPGPPTPGSTRPLGRPRHPGDHQAGVQGTN